jgi:hypothetical protein
VEQLQRGIGKRTKPRSVAEPARQAEVESRASASVGPERTPSTASQERGEAERERPEQPQELLDEIASLAAAAGSLLDE